MKANVEEILLRANFTKGSNHKEKLRDRLFGDRLVKMSEEELGMVAAAGCFDEYKEDKDSEDKC